MRRFRIHRFVPILAFVVLAAVGLPREPGPTTVIAGPASEPARAAAPGGDEGSTTSTTTTSTRSSSTSTSSSTPSTPPRSTSTTPAAPTRSSERGHVPSARRVSRPAPVPAAPVGTTPTTANTAATPATTTAPPPPTTAPVPSGPYKITRFNADGTPVRWDPCTPVRYVVNLTNAPPFARSEAAAAFAQLSSATGISFVDAGTTAETPIRRPASNPALYGPGYSPILISFMTAAEMPFASASASGYGYAGAATSASGRLQYVTGFVVLRPDHGWTQGISSANPLSLMLMHELGHVMGLSHVPTSTEVMGTGGNGSARAWGPGDRLGLAAVGRPAGCL